MTGVRVVFSVDVEEEGLFSGRYAPVAAGVRNVESLRRLEFVSREFGLPVSLLCTWPVFNDSGCRDILRHWQGELGAEVGAHLHPWNTPPLESVPDDAWTPSELMAVELLDAKLAELVRICREATGRAPVSFRMGRFDLGPKVRDLLPAHGLRVDTSIVPACWSAALPESFLSPTDPYPLLTDEDGRLRLLEAPITMAPVLPGLSAAVWRAAGLLGPAARVWLLRRFHVLAVGGTIPVWYPLPSMKLGARLHLARGGRVIHLFIHSSELMPGASPHVPDEAAVARVERRIRAFLHWLQRRAKPLGGLRGTTLAGLLPQLEEDRP
jgi:hypothetical protein